MRVQEVLEFGEEEDSCTFARVAETADRGVASFVGDGRTLSDEAGAAVPMAARGEDGFFGIGQTDRAFGRCGAVSDLEHCKAVL